MSPAASPSHLAPATVIDPEVLTAEQSSAAPVDKPASKGKPLSKSKTASKPKAAGVRKPSSGSKKPASSSAKKPSSNKKAPLKPSGDGKMTMEDMIKDAIQADKDNARAGVSRPAIKKYLAFRFKVLDTPANVTRLNKTILRGAEKGVFLLPKGSAGRVKLAKPVADVKPVASKPSPVKRPSSKVVAKAGSKVGVAKKVPAKKVGPSKKTTKVPTAPAKKTLTAVKKVGKKTSSTTKKVRGAPKKS